MNTLMVKDESYGLSIGKALREVEIVFHKSELIIKTSAVGVMQVFDAYSGEQLARISTMKTDNEYHSMIHFYYEEV